MPVAAVCLVNANWSLKWQVISGWLSHRINLWILPRITALFGSSLTSFIPTVPSLHCLACWHRVSLTGSSSLEWYVKVSRVRSRSLPHNHFSHRKPAHSCHADTRLHWFPCVFCLYPASSRFTSFFFWLAKEASPMTPSRCLIWDQTINSPSFKQL